MNGKQIASWVMCAALMLSMNACSGDDDVIGDESFIIGSWKVTNVNGYTIYDGKKESLKYDYDSATLTFMEDGTGHAVSDYDDVFFTWIYSDGQLSYWADDERAEYKLLKLTSTAMIWELQGVEYGVEVYMKITFKKTGNK